MGNRASCTTSIFSSRVTKVVYSDGRVKEYSKPVNAAELMLENSRQFVCDSGDLKVGHQIPGLAADEELKPRRLYFLLPMNMLYSVLTVEDMVSLSHKASKAVKQGGSKKIGRIFPALGDLCLFQPDFKPPEPSVKVPDHKGRFSRQRSWRPALDTIAENPFML